MLNGRLLRGRGTRNAFGVIIPPLHGSICNSVKTKWKSSGIGARRGHGVPSRYWSPLGVSEHFVGGWERLYKAFHGSWYIAVAFTCCFIPRETFPFLENVPENRTNPTHFFLPPPTLPRSPLSVGQRASRSSLRFQRNDISRIENLTENSFSRAFLFFFLLVGYCYYGWNDEEIVQRKDRSRGKE